MDYTEKDFSKILKSNALKMRRMMLKSGTTCMRVYDRNLERFPVTVDLYGPYARVTDYSEEGLDEEEERICCDIVSRMLYVQADRVIFHRRPKRVGKEQHSLQGETSLVVQVTENELFFTVDLTKRIDTGLFLDHMATRMLVESMSRGCRVLNLFSYTGSFSVYAARGGATSVESVDLSSTYTAWAEKNLADNGYSTALYPCVAADAWQYVVEALSSGKVYDLIIFDPPSFSNSRKMEYDFDVQRDYQRWMKVLNALLAKEGKLVFSTNLGTFRMDTKAVRGFEVQEITAQVAAPGFTRRLGTARTWLLEKQQDVRITAADLRTVERKAGRDRREEHVEEEVMKKEKVAKDIDVQQENVAADIAQEEAVQVDAIVAESAEEVVQEEESSDLELETEEAADEIEANEVEDDLLTLRWDDEDIAPLFEGNEEAEQDRTERAPRKERESRNDDHRGARDDRRPSYRDRDDRRSSGDRGERPSYRDRDDRRSSSDRPSYGERRPYGDRDGRPSFHDRDDRRPSGDRPSYGERRPYGDRDGRPSFRDRDDRRPSGDRPSYGERRPYGDRPERPSFRDRDDRRSSSDRPSYGERRPYGDRDGRPSFRDRDERRPFGDRDDRRPSSDRPSYGERRPYGDRDGRPSFRDRDERRPFGDRDDRRPSSDRPSYGERRPYGDRDGRPSSRDRDERRPFGDRDDRRPSSDRPSYGERRPFGDRSERPPVRRGEDRPAISSPRDEAGSEGRVKRERKSSPKPYGFDKFRETRTRGENENDSFFWLDDEGKNKDK
jgi:23S rRNA (guanine2445-N2)-methyltransferase / 23S rRNA (guanine2069-N7)-methyltransferase